MWCDCKVGISEKEKGSLGTRKTGVPETCTIRTTVLVRTVEGKWTEWEREGRVGSSRSGETSSGGTGGSVLLQGNGMQEFPEKKVP